MRILHINEPHTASSIQQVCNYYTYNIHTCIHNHIYIIIYMYIYNIYIIIYMAADSGHYSYMYLIMSNLHITMQLVTGIENL